MIEAAGFTIIEHPDPERPHQSSVRGAEDRRAGKTTSPPTRPKWRSAESLIAIAMSTPAPPICAALAAAARELQSLKPQRVALWGAGRLFDSLVRTGGFDPASLRF